jgi:peptide/nickel transport system permease protein
LLRYVIHRLFWGAVTLVGVVAMTFVLFDVLPNVDPAVLRAGRNASPAVIAEIRHNLGTDRPVLEQFWTYLRNLVLHFNLGYSYYSEASVKSLIADRLPATVSLVVGGVVLWLLMGVPVGIASAVKRGTWLDRGAMGAALVLVSAPVYWLGLVVLFLFASDIGVLKLFPGAGSYVPFTTDPVRWAGSMIMPWLVIAGTSAAIYARIVRGSLLDVLGEDYIRTARAKGLRERRVVLRHATRAGLTPLVTVLGLDIAILLGGVVLTETVFNIPGIGRLNYTAIVEGDFPVTEGTVLLAALFVVVANIVVDIAYAYMDPRVRYA